MSLTPEERLLIACASDHECRTCGAVYPLVPGYRARAPHGPDKSCTAPDGWRRLDDDVD